MSISNSEGGGKARGDRTLVSEGEKTYRCIHIHTIHPRRLLRRIRSGIDRGLQPRGERQQDRRSVTASRIVLHHLRVPSCMQIRRLPLPRNRNLVAAHGFSLVVQRLRDVSNEMYQELEGLLAIREGAAAVIDALGLSASLSALALLSFLQDTTPGFTNASSEPAQRRKYQNRTMKKRGNLHNSRWRKPRSLRPHSPYRDPPRKKSVDCPPHRCNGTAR